MVLDGVDEYGSHSLMIMLRRQVRMRGSYRILACRQAKTTQNDAKSMRFGGAFTATPTRSRGVLRRAQRRAQRRPQRRANGAEPRRRASSDVGRLQRSG